MALPPLVTTAAEVSDGDHGRRYGARRQAGVEAGVGALIDVVDSMTRDGDGRLQYHYTLVDFRADWISGEPRAGGDAADARWFTPAELVELDLWEETVRVIELARGME